MTIKLQFIVSWIVKRRRRNILFKLNTMNSAFQPQACNWKQSQSPVHQGILNGRVSTSTRVPGMDLGCSGLCTGLHTANLHGFVLLHCLHHRSYADITLEYWSRELDPSVTAFFFFSLFRLFMTHSCSTTHVGKLCLITSKYLLN